MNLDFRGCDFDLFTVVDIDVMVAEHDRVVGGVLVGRNAMCSGQNVAGIDKTTPTKV